MSASMLESRLSFSLCVVLTFAVAGLSSLEFSRQDFPTGFIFGAASSAYQVEGAASQDGRTPSTWDTSVQAGFPHGATGDIACDEYHKYKEDVKLMVETGLDAYRFSISWSRLIPNGRGPVNPKGFEYYNNLIDELIKHGTEPHVTLFHIDLPQALEDEYEGWLSRRIVKDFTEFADVCFREFGDRVLHWTTLHWTTLNEGNIFAVAGYDGGLIPPQRCSPPFGPIPCAKGNSSSEPYIAGHHLLLAHAHVARLYKKKYQGKQHGFIGVNIFGYWFAPLTNTKEDIIAVQRAKDFYLGWFLDPLTYGDYPKIMKKNAGSRIPALTKNERKQIKGSFDFIGINHYFTAYIKDNPEKLKIDQRNFAADVGVDMMGTNASTGSLMAAAFDFGQQYPIMPWGLQGVLEYLKKVYGNPPIYIHENGQIMDRSKTLNDTTRVEYLQAYIGALLDAIRNGSNTRGYFVWSFLDLFEIIYGYNRSFGLYNVDLDDPDLKRYPKLSAHWYSGFLKGKNITPGDSYDITKHKISSF